MKSEASGTVRLARQRATGAIGMARTTGDLMPDRAADSKASAGRKAATYVRTYAAAFGAGSGELRRAGVHADRYGWTVAFTQHYRGVPVFGAKLMANLDRDGHLTSVNGFAAPNLRLGTTPSIGKQEAARHALGLVRQQPPTSDSGKTGSVQGIKAAHTRLVVYRMGSVKGETGRAVLTYMVEVTNRTNVRDMVFIDALTGKPVNRYSMAADALERHLIEAAGSSNPATFTEVWKEGDPFPGALNADQQREVTGTGMAYWFFQDTFGRDSYDGAGSLDDHRQQRRPDQLPQRQLERRDHQLLQRRDVRRRRRPRVGPRLHRVHLRPDLPVAVGRAQRVVLRRVGRDRRPHQRRSRTRTRAT